MHHTHMLHTYMKVKGTETSDFYSTPMRRFHSCQVPTALFAAVLLRLTGFLPSGRADLQNSAAHCLHKDGLINAARGCVDPHR
ncbi:hypothetical protein XAP412_470091 [Xanthomonas phaseoli pv. phaseoli]|uniref:Secreted protein n=1 Tax=Xanthomonas campestris pv. phaseoli TaxID=317013 RepID=A0AB38E1J1_XANCH|nr:hypothetical protein XAP6984_520092 [Xanthomonas phaseoli pv. phaseoli]SON86270.1 hypothetical protein XAP412_470091 [Xanthomonas phaseoli pv. phaseoli]SON90570.1 hypothetical protein XAP7430_480140 [Xanthomonas phaseoli pv. phaseoli]